MVGDDPVDSPWQRCDAHGALLLEKRDSGVGNSEGTVSQQVRVRHRDGEVILLKEVTMRREHFGQINAAFSDDGLAVVVTISGGRDRVWALP